MQDNEKTPIDEPNQSTKIEKKPSQPAKASPHRKIFILMGFIFIVALVALVLSIYLTLINLQAQKKLNSFRSVFVDQIRQLEASQRNIQEQEGIKTATLLNNQTAFQVTLDKFNQQLRVKLNEQTDQTQEWQLLKARYYLELAQINSYWTTNYPASIELLQQADKLFQKFNDSKILEIRQAIAKEIAEIKAIQPLDISGFMSQIDAVQSSISSLNTESPRLNNTLLDATTSQSSDSSTWRSRLKDSVNLLGKLVVIRKVDEEISPLISPLYQSIIKESILLNLQEAQWAVLNQQPKVFELALKQAMNQLKKVANEKEANTKAIIQQLKTLQESNLIPKKPETGSALKLLNQFIDKQGAKT